jgi:hypothetical protein
MMGLSCASKPVGKSQELITSGVGTSLQEAKNDAIRQGIQYLVGSYVTSDMESSDESIIKDKVTDFTGAIVDRFEVIHQYRRNDGLFEMKARIRIAGDGGLQRNREAIAKPGKIDGQSLHAEALSRFKLHADTEQVWENTLAGFPERAFQYAVVNPSIAKTTGSNDQVTLAFYSVGFWRADFLKELRTVLKTTAHAAKAQDAHPYGIQWINESPDAQQTGICLMKGFRSVSRRQNVECYIVDLPNQHFEKWLCFKSGIDLRFTMSDSLTESIRFQNRMSKNLMPYLEVDRYGGAVFILYIVDNDMIEDRTDYQEHISALWTVDVPLDSLADVKKISARAECRGS